MLLFNKETNQQTKLSIVEEKKILMYKKLVHVRGGTNNKCTKNKVEENLAIVKRLSSHELKT